MRSINLLKSSNLTIFLEFVELRTKIASIIPFILGLMWSIYRYGQVSLIRTILLLVAVLTFDMATTAINNTLDYLKAKSEVYKREENVLGVFQLKVKSMVYILLGLLAISIICSLVLVSLTNLSLLIMGLVCFAIGILYTFGPTPISRSPYGEFFSGVTMGLGIPLIVVFVQDPSIMNLSLSFDQVIFQMSVLPVLETIIIALPLVCLIANIMLANNLCDYQMDVINERHTLVHYIGQEWGVKLYQTLSILPWAFWLLSILFGLLPWWTLVGFLAIYWQVQSLVRFSIQQIKAKTFIEAIKSFKLFSLAYLGCLGLSLLLNLFS